VRSSGGQCLLKFNSFTFNNTITDYEFNIINEKQIQKLNDSNGFWQVGGKDRFWDLEIRSTPFPRFPACFCFLSFVEL